MIFIQGSWGSIDYLGDRYKMYGMYIHHPSEHTVISLQTKLILILVWLRQLKV